MTLNEALSGKDIPDDVKHNLKIIEVEYFSFDNLIHQGQLVVHKKLAGELKEIFQELLKIKFPIKKVVPVVAYNWSDEDSMEDNNTSAFNYRPIYGTEQLSNHSYGVAIDINPLLNPYTAIDGTVFPHGAEYRPDRSGTFARGGKAVEIFLSRGWIWGANKERVDYQHFEKLV